MQHLKIKREDVSLRLVKFDFNLYDYHQNETIMLVN